MHEQDMAIVRALVPVAWADGNFADEEKQAIEALLEAYEATPDERTKMLDYASTRRTLDDIDLQDLSAGDRRVLIQYAVLVCYADGDYSADEEKLVKDLAARLKIPDAEVQPLIDQAAARAKKSLGLL